ncbi:MAG: hypothetical protein ACYTG1_10025 [Planctomycetota bacterium]|jgi:hypothetical protein
MEVFSGSPKLKAAAGSMHQFCPMVRAIFPPGHVGESVIEAATVCLYLKLAREVFNRRFVAKLRERLWGQLRYGTPAEVEQRVRQILERTEVLERLAQEDRSAPEETDFQRHVTSLIRSLFIEAGIDCAEPELVRETFSRFEETVRRIKSHLAGIKRQNLYIMR